MNAPPPFALLAELTHRCPLACPYCSNPLDLDRKADELSTDEWTRVFGQAAELGILQLHLSGGEPATRHDLTELVAAASEAGLYTNLITSGIGLDAGRLALLARAGLDHVQLSIQDVDAANADRVAGLAGSHRRKRAFAGLVSEGGLPLTINAVLHRGNLARMAAMVDEAIAMGARRIELAHAQYYGWAARNRDALMPDMADALAARDTVAALRDRTSHQITIDYVPPDHFARYPKPCMNGWGRQSLNVTPRGLVLPCHAAQTIPGLAFWSVRDYPLAAIWQESPAFGAFRGTDWMAEPCRSCDRREIDFGGCRCQAMALTGDPRNADPVCVLSPFHDRVEHLTTRQRSDAYVMRGRPSRQAERSAVADSTPDHATEEHDDAQHIAG
ncbi:pyrroloquinoline quinone biosynthesis protein PqqE [Bosea sp. (in: a-proteobacteria)]|uniref:pyrroloquinoline quinone biosynthesis protein PqqE n=1 Tax=Bosea sp. (in: a-proteobacteria) TaxID=1871050 RepID=UPI002735A736|nr:pyrroloquinoline quinone biosynthesis protein PqqE [Bosea sp. (in: a-proteobacteria)]MDP3411182.1 pyrroloquinoline quinone biosynthesis protein PqqE [Bosea sp. (in: a-proteobacteria)]